MMKQPTYIEILIEQSFVRMKKEMPEFTEAINSFSPETKEFFYQVYRCGFASGFTTGEVSISSLCKCGHAKYGHQEIENFHRGKCLCVKPGKDILPCGCSDFYPNYLYQKEKEENGGANGK